MDGAIGFDGLITGSITEGGGSGVTPHVTATASVNDQTGVPGVTVVRTGPDAAPNFDFNFVNLKGADGAPGAQGPQGLTGATGPAGAQGPRGFTGATGATGPAGADGYSPAVSVTDITGGHRVTITDETHPLGQNFDVMNGIDGTDGEDGSPGPEGPQGPAGEGVPTGGTAGQYLRKAGPGDYITEWATPAAAEVSFDIDNCQIVTSTDLQGAVEELDAELTSVSSSLTKSEWQTLGTSSSSYRVDKGFVFIRVHNADTQARTELTLGTLPSELRPTSQVNVPIVGGSYRELTGVCQVKSNGNVTLYTDSAGRYYGYFCYSL